MVDNNSSLDLLTSLRFDVWHHLAVIFIVIVCWSRLDSPSAIAASVRTRTQVALVVTSRSAVVAAEAACKDATSKGNMSRVLSLITRAKNIFTLRSTRNSRLRNCLIPMEQRIAPICLPTLTKAYPFTLPLNRNAKGL